jgi:hypothetical protein
MTLKRLTNQDKELLGALIMRYGADCICHELWTILKPWSESNKRYRLMAKAAGLLAYHARLALGTVPRLTGTKE